METIDDNIVQIHQGTRTVLPLFTSIHDKLRLKLPWYYRWHMKKNLKYWHLAILILAILLIIIFSFMFYKSLEPAVTKAAATWTVSGAGGADWNGIYVEIGTYNGKTSYQKNDDSGHYLFWSTFNNWQLANGLGATLADYFGNITDPNLPANPWSISEGIPGIPPPPTLSSGGGGDDDGDGDGDGDGSSNTAPRVSSVWASQDSKGMVNINYNISDDEQSQVNTSFYYWDGSTWRKPITTTGEGSTRTGSDKFGTWLAKTNYNGHYTSDMKIKVMASDGLTSGFSESASFILDTKDPVGLSDFTGSKQGQESINLSWHEVSDDTFDHYEIWYKNQPGINRHANDEIKWDQNQDSLLASSSTQNTIIKGSFPDSVYYLKIWAIDKKGNEATISEINTSTQSETCQGFDHLIIIPDSVKLMRNAKRAFNAKAINQAGDELSDIIYDWSADGGTIDAFGGYTAPADYGIYRVLVTSNCGGASQSKVIVTGATEVLISAINSVVRRIGSSGISTTTSGVMALAIPLAAAAAAIPYLPQAFNTFSYLKENFRTWLGLRRKKKRWGVVFDDISKKPLSFTRLFLYSWPNKKLIETTVANNLGEFGFLVSSGKYLVQATLSGFNQKALSGEKLGSRYLSNRTDDYYDNLYYQGQIIDVSVELQKKTSLDISIPLISQTEPSFLQRAILRLNKFLKIINKIRLPLLILGTILSTLTIIYRHSWIDWIIFVFYISIWIYEIYALFYHVKTAGIIYDDQTQKSLDLVLVRLISSKTGKIVSTFVTGPDGQFLFSAPSGNYSISAVKANYDPFFTKPFQVKSLTRFGKINIKMKRWALKNKK